MSIPARVLPGATSVRFGRIGTTGQSSTKSFDDDAAANRHTEKLIASKLKKGYTKTISA